jgi:arsenate reductase
MSVTIYHNSRCSKSRATLALLETNNAEVSVIEYLTTPPSADELKRILVLLGMTPRELLRLKDSKKAGINDPYPSDDTLLAMMVANPEVIERPIVISGKKAKIGRPPEAALDIL